MAICQLYLKYLDDESQKNNRLLAEFYLGRDPNFKLISEQSHGSLTLRVNFRNSFSAEDYEKCRKEMKDFTIWLQNKFFP